MLERRSQLTETETDEKIARLIINDIVQKTLAVHPTAEQDKIVSDIKEVMEKGYGDMAVRDELGELEEPLKKLGIRKCTSIPNLIKTIINEAEKFEREDN